MNTTARPPRRAAVTLGRARQSLREGAAVVLPNAAPLTHVVTATRASTVNEAKGRPSDQPVALWAHHPDTLASLDQVWDLGREAAETARWMLAEERLTVLVPVRPDPSGRPAWLGPAVKDGWMLLFGARWQPLVPLLDEHPVLYVSSANRTGHPPAATAEDALRMFPPGVEVLRRPDGGTEPRAADGPARRATTTIRLHTDGSTKLHRHGAQDQDTTGPDAYLRRLRRRRPRSR